MSDLISRSELYDELGNKLTWLMAYGDDVYLDVGSDIKDVIDNMPTAYNIDKVVEKLKYNIIGQLGNDEVIRIPRDKAIEIVKDGGVSDDVCEWIKYDYRTICPKNHDANNPYWRIPDNTDKLKYCPYCGKKIKVVE